MPPRPLPRRAAASPKSTQRLADIVQAGREVFSERGYAEATTSEIALRLGVSEATVFTYFRSKRELCARVVADWYDEIIAALEQGLPRGAPWREQLAFLVHTHLRLFLTPGLGMGMCALVLSEGRSKGQALGDLLLPQQRRYTAPLMDLLARGQASGDVRTDLPLRLLRPLVLGPMEHLLWEAVGAGRKLDVTANANALTTLLLAALAPPGQELQRLRQLRQQVLHAASHC